MYKKQNAIILGGTSAHIDLINRLKERGYYTILVDYFDNPIAKNAADEHIKESTLDKEKVLDIARTRNASLIISSSVDQANVTAIYVSEKLGLYVPYSYKTALEISNKTTMKKKMIENDIKTSKYFVANNIKDCENHNLKYPVIVKPSDSNGSKGVRRANNGKELNKYLTLALEISRDKKAIVEEFKVGREIGLDCIIKNGKVDIIISRERKKINKDDITIQQIYGSIWPATLTKNENQELQRNINAIATVFQLNNTPIIIQAIINDEGVNIIEFAPRIGGGENSRIIKLSTGFDMINATIDSYLGKEITVKDIETDGYFKDCLIYAKPGKYGYIDGHKKLIDSGILEYHIELKTRGMTIGNDLSSSNRVAACVIKSETIEGLKKKEEELIRNFKVYNVNGEEIMRRDIYF